MIVRPSPHLKKVGGTVSPVSLPSYAHGVHGLYTFFFCFKIEFHKSMLLRLEVKNCSPYLNSKKAEVGQTLNNCMVERDHGNIQEKNKPGIYS